MCKQAAAEGLGSELSPALRAGGVGGVGTLISVRSLLLWFYLLTFVCGVRQP